MQVVARMSLFYLHPDDRRWLKRWFRNNLVCVAAIIGFLLILRFSAMVQDDANASSVQGKNQVVIPEGWRRTTQGWEHTTQWHFTQVTDSAPAAALPLAQPKWVMITMETLRRTSPLVIAMAQLAAVAGIIGLSKRRRSSDQAGEIRPAD